MEIYSSQREAEWLNCSKLIASVQSFLDFSRFPHLAASHLAHALKMLH